MPHSSSLRTWLAAATSFVLGLALLVAPGARARAVGAIDRTGQVTGGTFLVDTDRNLERAGCLQPIC
ncbi:hypothetical protein [Euzebya rosea]|uniref:hypothetical protein n=1 Tax=Euzebya rosea TaxID=2052804 RepID=UPI000D3E11B4|nr:hypothetical protein [Euzebya rosea]